MPRKACVLILEDSDELLRGFLQVDQGMLLFTLDPQIVWLKLCRYSTEIEIPPWPYGCADSFKPNQQRGEREKTKGAPSGVLAPSSDARSP